MKKYKKEKNMRNWKLYLVTVGRVERGILNRQKIINKRILEGRVMKTCMQDTS